MEAFPLLREEVDRIVSEHIRNNENRCKDHVRFLLDFELAYINTNHEVSLFSIFIFLSFISRILLVLLKQQTKQQIQQRNKLNPIKLFDVVGWVCLVVVWLDWGVADTNFGSSLQQIH